MYPLRSLLRNSFAALAFTTLWVFAPGAFAQDTTPAAQTTTPPAQPTAQDQPFTLKVKSQAVVLDVVVTDKQGNVVTNLGKDNFEVYQDKQLQNVRYFEAPAPHGAPAKIAIDSTKELDAKEPDAPVTILVLDEIMTKFEDQAFARYSLKKFLDRQGDTLEQPTLFVAVDMNNFMLLHDYTTSKKELLATLDRHLANYPWGAAAVSAQGQQFNATFASLMEVAAATTGHPGHKSVIWIGRGFPSIDPTHIPVDEEAALKGVIETCTNALRDARVVLYTLDPAGVNNTPPSTLDDQALDVDDPFGRSVDFNAMAKATGGEAFYGRNDVDNLIATSARDAASFYTLTYVPVLQIEDEREFHSIKVRMKDKNLHAASREGYYPEEPPPPPAQNAAGKFSSRLIYDLTVASGSMMIYDGAALNVTRDASDPDTLSIVMKTAGVPWKAVDGQKLSAEITLLTISFDRKGKRLERKPSVRLVQVPAAADDPNRPANATFNLLTTISTKPPAARIRLVVRLDGNGKMGTENVFLVDPRTLADPETGLKSQKLK